MTLEKILMGMSWGVKVISICYWVSTDLKKEKTFFFSFTNKKSWSKGLNITIWILNIFKIIYWRWRSSLYVISLWWRLSLHKILHWRWRSSLYKGPHYAFIDLILKIGTKRSSLRLYIWPHYAFIESIYVATSCRH